MTALVYGNFRVMTIKRVCIPLEAYAAFTILEDIISKLAEIIAEPDPESVADAVNYATEVLVIQRHSLMPN